MTGSAAVVTDSVICDLDGVVYRGSESVPRSPDALRRLREHGIRVLFATNNSSRTAEEVANKIYQLSGFKVKTTDVVTSGQAAVTLIPEAIRRCLVVGGPGLSQAVLLAGRDLVDDPDLAECVIVGIDQRADYDVIHRAASAVRNGAVFIASNIDPTFPTATGLKPGAGALVAAVSVASGVTPMVAGKPEEAMRALIRDRGVERAWVIGDRLDTDIEMARREPDWTSILVLTGVTASGNTANESDFVAPDLSGAVDLVLSAGDRQ